jgi:hypothetical protein
METPNNSLDQLKKAPKPELRSGYFSELKASLMEAAKNDPKPQVRRLYNRPLFWITSIAAAAVLLIAIRLVINEPIPAEISFSSLSNEEILSYIDANIDDFDEEHLAEVYDSRLMQEQQGDTTKKRTITVTEVKPETVPASTTPVTFESLSEEDIMNYLKSQEMTEEELEESLGEND